LSHDEGFRNNFSEISIWTRFPKFNAEQGFASASSMALRNAASADGRGYPRRAPPHTNRSEIPIIYCASF